MKETHREACRAAAGQFDLYADNHLKKIVPDHDKARTNREWAERMRAATADDEVTVARIMSDFNDRPATEWEIINKAITEVAMRFKIVERRP